MVAPTGTSERLAGDTQAQPSPSLTRLMQELKLHLAEFGEYASYLIALEIDRVKLTAKRIGLYAALGVLGLVIVTAMLAAGTGLFVLGIAGLLGMLFGNFWVGATVVGLLMFILVGVGAWIGLTIMNKSAYKALRLKYADRRQRQKKMYGRDVKEVARG